MSNWPENQIVNKPKIIKKENDIRKLDIIEAILIQEKDASINKQDTGRLIKHTKTPLAHMGLPCLGYLCDREEGTNVALVTLPPPP